MTYYNVTFKYSETTYCTNIAHGEIADVIRHYESKYSWVNVKTATLSDVETAKRKGMPIIEIAPTPEEPEEPEEIAPAPVPMVSISKGNIKTGCIKSVSLPAILSCKKDLPCYKECYAKRMQTFHTSVYQAYKRNFDILQSDPAEYFRQIDYTVKFERFFRWHVAGDMTDSNYFDNMVKIANNNLHCIFMAFTKQFEIVNSFLDNGGIIPDNLRVIFSTWEGLEVPNPYDLPTSHVVFKGCEVPQGAKLCGGNCQECTFTGAGCWNLKKGEKVAFFKH